MKRWILSIVGIMIMVLFAKPVISWSATEIEKMTFDLANQQATIIYETGNFVTTTSVATNGDTVQTNSFVPNGGYYTAVVNQPAFSQLINGLLQSQSVNIDAITNSAIGITGTAIAQQDTTVTDMGTASLSTSAPASLGVQGTVRQQ